MNLQEDTREDKLAKFQAALNLSKDKISKDSGRNDRFYDPHYLVVMCFTNNGKLRLEQTELFKMSLEEINNLITIASYASEIFN